MLSIHHFTPATGLPLFAIGSLLLYPIVFLYTTRAGGLLGGAIQWFQPLTATPVALRLWCYIPAPVSPGSLAPCLVSCPRPGCILAACCIVHSFAASICLLPISSLVYLLCFFPFSYSLCPDVRRPSCSPCLSLLISACCAALFPVFLGPARGLLVSLFPPPLFLCSLSLFFSPAYAPASAPASYSFVPLFLCFFLFPCYLVGLAC